MRIKGNCCVDKIIVKFELECWSLCEVNWSVEWENRNDFFLSVF